MSATSEDGATLTMPPAPSWTDELPPPEDRPTPWPEGLRSLYLRLTPDAVTGRRLLEA